MAGQNRFSTSQFRTHASTPCVFISHSSNDKPFAKVVADALLAMSVDIYFDQYDEALKVASGDAAIVKCIEDGLTASTHLLGLITLNTKESWWVPYEIGGAVGRKKDCAHLIAGNVQSVPSFIKVAKVLFDQDDVSGWIASLRGTGKEALFETLKKSATYSSTSTTSVFPRFRSASGVSFY